MAKTKYRFNPESLSFDLIRLTIGQKMFRVLAYLISSLFVGGGLLLIISMFWDLPKERILKRELDFLKTQYELTNKKMEQTQAVLTELQNRDDNIYRVIFEADPVPSSVRNAGFGGVNRYADLEGYRNTTIVKETTLKLDEIMNKLYVQSKSYDLLFDLGKDKQKMLTAIPSIIPMERYTRIGSFFSHKRLHPILKVYRPHNGVDFTAPVGTKVRAAGDGTVVEVNPVKGFSGYGITITINHGYSYETFYAHLNKVLVKAGEQVKRGQIIGESGNTGLSIAPHLHFEVRKNGALVDPINYLFTDITPREYQELIEMSKLGGQSLD
ncbi:MAG TPA: peptidase M23 [Bacteroidales bacterium]|nr:peptidase M23 [Bacteroidales bacterium]